MADGSLTEFRVLTFDCYGTLIDWETGIWAALQPLLEANEAQERVGRGTALAEFGRHESEQEGAHPTLAYPAVLEGVHRALAESLGLVSTRELDREFGSSVGRWPAFPDSVDALQVLSAHYRLVILSNVDRESFDASNRRLGVTFDAVYTAQDIGSYKPDPANFEYLLSHLASDLGLGPTDVLHTAQSMFHDHVPATRLGLATAWIDRQRLSERGSWGATAAVEDPPTTDFVFFSLGDMAEAVSAAFGAG